VGQKSAVERLSGMERPIEFHRVAEIWRAADEGVGKDTLGILLAFQPPLTTQWVEDEISTLEIEELRFIGGVRGDRFEQVTGGTYRVGDSTNATAAEEDFAWNPSWYLIAVRDPENGRRVLIDGNGRALLLLGMIRRHALPPDTKVRIIVGDLAQSIVFRAKTVAPLWR
jgi:hypothetical protein